MNRESAVRLHGTIDWLVAHPRGSMHWEIGRCFGWLLESEGIAPKQLSIPVDAKSQDTINLFFELSGVPQRRTALKDGLHSLFGVFGLKCGYTCMVQELARQGRPDSALVQVQLIWMPRVEKVLA